MKDIITVYVMDGFVEYNHDKTEVLAETFAGDVYKAELHKETQEYHAKDSECRSFYVGELNFDDELILDECFVLWKD